MIFLQHEKGWDNMLTKTRQKEILKLLENRGSVTLQELKDHLNTSESTIRRDLNTLDAQGKLVKVFGGAVAGVTKRRKEFRRKKTDCTLCGIADTG